MDSIEKRERSRSYILGIGLDTEKGEFRVTRGDDFQILGGSEKTHRTMQDKILSLQDELAREGRTISSLKPAEYKEVTRILKES